MPDNSMLDSVISTPFMSNVYVVSPNGSFPKIEYDFAAINVSEDNFILYIRVFHKAKRTGQGVEII
jgi:hypothetical protein